MFDLSTKRVIVKLEEISPKYFSPEWRQWAKGLEFLCAGSKNGVLSHAATQFPPASLFSPSAASQNRLHQKGAETRKQLTVLYILW